MARAAATSSSVEENRARAFRLAMVGIEEGDLPVGAAGERLGRRRPDGLDRLAGVVGDDLVGRRLGHEEPGVEPAGGAAGRGDPVRDVVHPRQVEHQPFRLEDGRRGRPARRGRRGGSGPAGRRSTRQSGVEPGAGVGVAGEEDPRLLEALPGGGHPVGQPTGRAGRGPGWPRRRTGRRRSGVPTPSPSSTRPPGKTQASAAKTDSGCRRNMSTSSDPPPRSPASRTSITVAAGCTSTCGAASLIT